VYLEAGEHQVEFNYRPLSFYVGLAVSGLTWATLVVWVAMGGRRTRKKGM